MKASTIGLLGAGRMGRGIAQAFAFGGHEVHLIDIKSRSEEDLEKLRSEALAEIDAGISMMVQFGALDERDRTRIVERVSFAGRQDAPEAIRQVDVMFEGVPETVDAKRQAFDFACLYLQDDAVIASTTSTILSSELAALVRHPQRFVNAHWLNPAFLVPIVEISPHIGTSAHIVEKLDSILRGIGKRPVHCAAAPGYIVPRLQSLIMNEAARMVEEGVASPADIDAAIRFGFGFRYTTMGVIEFIDFGGLDTFYHANRYLTEALGERYRLAPIVERYMSEGRIGIKSGRGFIDYSDQDLAAYRFGVLSRQYKLLKFLDAAPRLDSALAHPVPLESKKLNESGKTQSKGPTHR